MTRPSPHLDQRSHDLTLLAAGQETGWWDKHGRPAPWPEDFFLTDGTINPDWSPNPHPESEPITTTDTSPSNPPY